VEVSRGITFKKLWFDDDVVELEITTSSDEASFRCRVFASHEVFKSVAEELNVFKHHIHGGIFDIRFGATGPEFAGGAFHARLHFHQKGLGKLFITVTAESEWSDFTVAKVANRCVVHLASEQALLDSFIGELTGLHEGTAGEAFLQLAQP
jgi:hypothetical protein